MRPEKWDVSQMLPQWPIWASLFSSVFYRFSEIWTHKPCFRQARCFMQKPSHFLSVPPNPTCTRSHIWGSPIVRPLRDVGLIDHSVEQAGQSILGFWHRRSCKLIISLLIWRPMLLLLLMICIAPFRDFWEGGTLGYFLSLRRMFF